MENPDLVLQETGSSPTHSRLNYVPSGDTLRRDAISSLFGFLWGLGGVVVRVLTSNLCGSNLGPGPSCWKVGSYLPMPGGLQCSMHWFPPPVNYLLKYDPGC